jgi:hypothetical protein
MKALSAQAHETVDAQMRLNGLIAGVLGGMGFALGAWGVDAILLARAQADLPFLKLALGMLPCLLIGGLAGWLTARFDRGLVAFIVWMVAGCTMVWLVSHMPFEGVSSFLSFTEPSFRGITTYPFVLSAKVRMNLLYVVVGLLSGFFGIFLLFRIETAVRATHALGRLVSLALFLPFMFIAGLAADNLINEPLRSPILAMDQLFQYGLQAETHPFSKDQIQMLHLRALDPFKEYLHQPRELRLGDYDPESLVETSVIVKIKDDYFRCSVIDGQPVFCQSSANTYLNSFNCLLLQGDGEGCGILVSEVASQQLAPLVGQAQEIGILNQYGTAVLIAVHDKNDRNWICSLNTQPSAVLDGCQPALNGFDSALAMQIVGPSLTPRVESSTPSPSGSSQTVITPPASVAAPTPTLETGVTISSPILPFAQAEAAALTSAPVYTITVSIDYENHKFQGHETVKYYNTEDVPLDQLYFRLFPNGQKSYGNGSLTASQVTANGQPVETQLSYNNSALNIQLPEILQPGKQTRIDMDFTGLVPVDFGGNATPAGYGIYNYSDGVLALSGWYPILAVFDQGGWDLDPVSAIGDSVYSDTGFYTVDLSSPADLVVASTGIATQRKTTNEITQYRFISGPVRDFTMVMSPDFKVSSRTVDSTRVNSYYLPGNSAGGERALSVASDSLNIYNQHFGPYPFAELDVVDTPMRNASGVEYPGIVLIADNLYENPQSPNFIVTVAHEVAHQWWYSAVGNDVIDEPWLDEALTTYSSSLYYEFMQGPAAAEGLYSYWQERYQALAQQGMDDQIAQSLTHFEDLDPRIYGGIVYSKGALFFRALRQEIGDEAFFEALQTYYHDYQFKIAAGKDLLNAFERAAGRSLESFFQEWLYSPKK